MYPIKYTILYFNKQKNPAGLTRVFLLPPITGRFNKIGNKIGKDAGFQIPGCVCHNVYEYRFALDLCKDFGPAYPAVHTVVQKHLHMGSVLFSWNHYI